MKTLILIFFILSLILISCSTTTHYNLTATYPEYIETELNKVEKNTGVGIEVSLLRKDGTKVYGELLSVRDSTMILCTEYSATEEELAGLSYPILFFSNNEIQELIIEGSNWVWEGIAAGTTVGALVAIGGPGTQTINSKEDEEEVHRTEALIFSLFVAAGWGIGYVLSTEEYVLQDVPTDYNWSFLKPLTRYPDKEPEYLKAME